MVAPLAAAAGRAASGAVKGAAKKSRPKTKADARYNERRRARRAAERLKKQAGKQSGRTRAETLKRADKLMQQVSESYVNKATGQYSQQVGALDQLTAQSNQYYQARKEEMRALTEQENMRRNQMMRNYFKSAAKTMSQLQDDDFTTPEQRLARMEQSAFYSTTKVLWMGSDPRYRDENIVEAMQGISLESGRKISNLQDAFEYVKQQSGSEWPTMEKVLRGEIDTDDYDFQGEAEEESASPPVYTLSDFRSWGAFV